eukprot:3586509-Pleurochrysis_carterae.AAC.1
MRRRAELQRGGTLPQGSQHVAPRYIQVYIDDFSGVSLDDAVAPPDDVAHIEIELAHTAATGGTPAPRGTRAHVHAQLA